MATILTYFGYTLIVILVIVFLTCMIAGLKIVVWFNFRVCKYCHHVMDYRGLKEDERNGHYLFHCKHCGAWEQIPKEELARSCDKDCNPNEL